MGKELQMQTGDKVLMSHQQEHCTLLMLGEDKRTHESIRLLFTLGVNLYDVMPDDEYAEYQQDKKPAAKRHRH